MTLSTFTILCNRRHRLVPEIRVAPNGNSMPIRQSVPARPCPSPAAATTELHSVTTDLPFLCAPYTWTHTICGLLCPASLTLHNVFKVHHLCSSHQFFVSFDGWIIFRCVNAPHSVYPVIGWWVCGLSSPFSDCEQCCYEPLSISFCLNVNSFFEVFFPLKHRLVYLPLARAAVRGVPLLCRWRACPLVILFSSLFSCLLIISSRFLYSLFPAQICVYMWVLPHSDNLEFILANGFPPSLKVIFFK